MGPTVKGVAVGHRALAQFAQALSPQGPGRHRRRGQ